MPVNVKVTDHGLGFIMEGEGTVTGKEILTGIDERFSSDEKTKKYLYGMSDYTKVTSIQMTPDEVELVAKRDESAARLNPDIVIAIAAPKDAMYGLSRMFKVYATKTEWKIDVHRDIISAKAAILDMLKSKDHDTATIKFAADD